MKLFTASLLIISSVMPSVIALVSEENEKVCDNLFACSFDSPSHTIILLLSSQRLTLGMFVVESCIFLLKILYNLLWMDCVAALVILHVKTITLDMFPLNIFSSAILKTGTVELSRAKISVTPMVPYASKKQG
jgi:hypothetical protein